MQSVLKDFTITLEDRPGVLAKVTEAIAKAGINIEGAAAVPCDGKGTFHVLTPDAPATRRALETAGFRIAAEQAVLVVDVDDRPGAAASIFRRIADQEVNVTLAYLVTNNRLAIGADDLQKVTEALEKQPSATTIRR